MPAGLAPGHDLVPGQQRLVVRQLATGHLRPEQLLQPAEHAIGVASVVPALATLVMLGEISAFIPQALYQPTESLQKIRINFRHHGKA